MFSLLLRMLIRKQQKIHNEKNEKSIDPLIIVANFTLFEETIRGMSPTLKSDWKVKRRERL